MTDVNKEEASRRTSVTVRYVLAGAGILVLGFSICAAMMLKDTTTPKDAVIAWYVISLAAVVGLVVIGGTFAKMNRGIRQQNLKAIGITLIAVLVVILALVNEHAVEAAIGLLSAIAGYLFGKDSSSDDNDSPSSASIPS